MDIQVVLVVILSLLTINLIVVGIYVIMVLKEFRETVRKMNKVLDTVQSVSDSVAAPITNISGMMAGLTSGLKVFSAIKSFKSNRKEER